jgi:demethoxyubiquinone hydroxylase (CLK1/Coq7/Cat5 family)
MLYVDEETVEGGWVDGAFARFEATNARLEPATQSLLATIVASDRVHPRFINTLSMLEHMGSHKIMATQHGAGIGQATLRHVAEEAHHAYFMKRQAEKAARKPLDYMPSELLAPAAARMYFQRLEAVIVRLLDKEDSLPAAYLYMSMIVEFRALWFYRLYQETLRRASHAMSLKRVIGEEQNHLAEMAERLDRAGELRDARVDPFVATETRLFERLLSSMQRAMQAGTS